MVKTCSHCGDTFIPRFPNARLCYLCWRRREDAFLLLDTLESDLADARRQLADVSDLADGLESALTEARQQLTAARGAADIPPDLYRVLLGLCHPDRHGNSPAANRATAWLLAQRPRGRAA